MRVAPTALAALAVFAAAGLASATLPNVQVR